MFQGVHRTQHTPGFLKLFLSVIAFAREVSVYVCVFLPPGCEKLFM